jgi:hypothetical protein
LVYSPIHFPTPSFVKFGKKKPEGVTEIPEEWDPADYGPEF